jgi:ADYC domain
VLDGLSQQAPDGSWSNLCQPDPDGRRLGFPLQGAFTPDGRHVDAPGRLLVTCTGGAEGKCVRFGHKPWGRAPDGTPLAPYYQACVRLVRADYCGDGVGHTRDGTPVDLFDRVGVQADGMTLEAAFGPGGAACVRHARLPDVLGTDAPAAPCPRLAGRLGEACDEAAPALLYVRSCGRWVVSRAGRDR